jgi:hypothetical protein
MPFGTLHISHHEKVLNVIIKCVAKEGKIQGIKLPIRQ